MNPLGSILTFVALGGAFVLVNLCVGSLLRPRNRGVVKGEPYECGEPSVGSGWVQFDLRFYIVALVFLVFDVEVALFYPWAVLWGSAASFAQETGQTVFELRSAALVDLLAFFGLIIVGFAYLWRFGYLDWVRSSVAQESTPVDVATPAEPAITGAIIDPNAIADITATPQPAFP